MRKPTALLRAAGLVALTAACDSGVSDPPPKATRYAVTVSGPSTDRVPPY